MAETTPWWRTMTGVPPSWERMTTSWDQAPSSLWAFFGLSMVWVAALSIVAPRATVGGVGGFIGAAFANYLRARRRERAGAG